MESPRSSDTNRATDTGTALGVEINIPQQANSEQPRTTTLEHVSEGNQSTDGLTGAIPFEQAVAKGLLSRTHKESGPGIPLIVDNDRYDNVGTEGGVTWVDGHAISVRAPIRRVGRTAAVHTADVMELSRLTHAYSRSTKVALVAFELETLEIDNDGHLQGDPAPEEEHPEVIIGCVEGITTPSSSLFEAAKKYLQMQKDLRARAAANGRLSYTGSNLGDRPLTPADLNIDNQYIGPMIEFVGGPEVVVQTDGISEQNHIDDTGTAAASAWTFNIEELLGPVDMAYSAASPFARGERYPTFEPKSPYPIPNADQGFGAARLFGRIALPEGGVILQFVPEDLEGQAGLIDRRMRAGLHNPTRAVGSHSNRWRVDYGGRENCATDTNGGHIESSMSLVALNRAFRHTLQQAYDRGDVERLERRYPRIIRKELDDHQLLRAKVNSVTMTQIRGLDGNMVALDGSICSGRDMLEDKIRLVANEVPDDSPYHVNDEMIRWIRLRATMPKTLGGFILDSHGNVSTEGFFRGRPGPLAAHMHARVYSLVLRGMPPPDAIANTQANVARAHNRYLDRIRPERNFGFLAAAGEAA